MESVENNTEYNKPCYKKIIVTLGTFQTVMNLFGAIGTIMENTGLSNALETIYKENSLLNILKGKAVSRVLSAHFIIDQCLSTLMGKKYTTIQEEITLKSELHNLYSSLKNGEINIKDVDANNTLQFLCTNLKNQLENLTTASRTTSLWLCYQYLLDLVQNFIRSLRCLAVAS